MLIGLDYYWKLVTGRNKVKKSTDLPIAMETEFGWILVSNSNDPGMHSQSNTNIQTMLNMVFKLVGNIHIRLSLFS